MLNWIVRNWTVFDLEIVYLRLTELFEIELFWRLTVNKSYTYTKLNCLKINSALNDPKSVALPYNKPTDQPTKINKQPDLEIVNNK